MGPLAVFHCFGDIFRIKMWRHRPISSIPRGSFTLTEQWAKENFFREAQKGKKCGKMVNKAPEGGKIILGAKAPLFDKLSDVIF